MRMHSVLSRWTQFGRTTVGRWMTVAALICLTSLPCAAVPVVNGGFDSGLTGWTSQGDVSATTYATLGDGTAIYSQLYQGTGVTPGLGYVLEFDVRGALAGSLEDYPDTFYASLYFIDDLSALDLASDPPVFDGNTPLLDLTEAGPTVAVGSLGASALGPDWLHFTYTFSTPFAYAIPVFELLDFDGIAGNSTVSIDNVSITESVEPIIPEPATLMLVTLGLAGGALARRRRR